AKRPLASLTTLTLTVEPSRFALTTTPSMALSSAEPTWPESAAGACARAAGTSAEQTAAAPGRGLLRVFLQDLAVQIASSGQSSASPGPRARPGKRFIVDARSPA